MHILFLCTGNSCRSVLSEAAFNHLAPQGREAISAAGETCPAYLGPVLRTHWGLEDPSHVTGSEAGIEAAFERTHAIILARTRAFLALPLDELREDKVRFKRELDRIGTLLP